MSRSSIIHASGRQVAITLVTVLATTGCVTPGDILSSIVNSGQATWEIQVRDALLSSIADSRQATGESLVRDALLGHVVGGLAGAYVAHKQQQYSNKEDQLDAMIADVRKSYQEMEKLIESIRLVIAEDKQRLAAVERQVRKGQAAQADLAAARRRITDIRAAIAQATKGAREKQDMFQNAERQYRQLYPGTDTGVMQRALDTHNKKLSTLDSLAGSVAVA